MYNIFTSLALDLSTVNELKNITEKDDSVGKAFAAFNATMDIVIYWCDIFLQLLLWLQ